MSEQKINSIKNEALSLIAKAAGEKELNDLKIKFLGRKSEFNSILKDLKEMPEEQRRTVGALANVAKKEIENAFIKKEKDLKEKSFDFEAEKIVKRTEDSEKAMIELKKVCEEFNLKLFDHMMLQKPPFLDSILC